MHPVSRPVNENGRTPPRHTSGDQRLAYDEPVSATTTDVQWLSEEQQQTWRAYINGSTLLFERLDRDLREQFDVSLPEYEILVRLSESPHYALRMAVLASSVSHSRSRVTHTIARLERKGLVARRACPNDGRGVIAELTECGWRCLVAAAPVHVGGVRTHLIEMASAADLAALRRVFAEVGERLGGG